MAQATSPLPFGSPSPKAPLRISSASSCAGVPATCSSASSSSCGTNSTATSTSSSRPESVRVIVARPRPSLRCSSPARFAAWSIPSATRRSAAAGARPSTAACAWAAAQMRLRCSSSVGRMPAAASISSGVGMGSPYPHVASSTGPGLPVRSGAMSDRSVIAHLDLDAFYASVELLRRPGLRGRPVIVSGSGPRAVVTTATYEARRFGVGSAMPTARALRLCPDAVLIPPDFVAYRDASRRVWDLVRRHVGVVEQTGLDEGYLDLSGHVAPKAALRRLVSEIRAATGLTASVGIGPNKLVAKVASDAEKPQGFVALSREMACERFEDASPGLIPGIGPKTVVRLEKQGITTLGALQDADDRDLAAHFGANNGLRRRALFHGSTNLETQSKTVSESCERTFDID